MIVHHVSLEHINTWNEEREEWKKIKNLNPSYLSFSLSRILEPRKMMVRKPSGSVKIHINMTPPPPPHVKRCCVAVSSTSTSLALSSIHSPCIIHTHNCTVSYDSVHYSYRGPGAVMFWGMLVQWPPSPVSPISITISDKARAIEGGEILASSR